MDNRFYVQGPEDEMEFMPIIPLNEEDDGSAGEPKIPAEIPILALRNRIEVLATLHFSSAEIAEDLKNLNRNNENGSMT